MNKLNNTRYLCQSYIAKIGGRYLRSSKLKTFSGRRKSLGLLSILTCGVLLFVNCPDPQQMAQKETVYDVTLLAGSTQGYTEGSGAAAQFSRPAGVAVDAAGIIYVADTINNRLRKVTSAGVVSLFAGSDLGYADGSGAAAQFHNPYGIAVSSAGIIYVADSKNNRIRQVTSAGVVSLLAGSSAGYVDGSGANARFDFPQGIAVANGKVYVADTNNDRLRESTSTGVVSLLAGSGRGNEDGTGAMAQFDLLTGVAVAADGTVYVADAKNHQIRKITSAGVVSVLAGSGTAGYTEGSGLVAQFRDPHGVAVGADGTVYVADTDNNRIRKITSAGAVSLVAGSGTAGNIDGTGSVAQFDSPTGVAVGSDGTIYVADSGNHRIRKITPRQVNK